MEGSIQESFQQNLVDIGSVVSEENIFFINFIPPFSIFSLAAMLVESRDHRTQFGSGLSKNHSTKVWLQLAKWFLRSRLKCEMLTDDDGRKVMTIAQAR